MRLKIIPYNTNLKLLARNLRSNSTLGEILLWKRLNKKQVCEYDFHRQKPLLNYIVDFYCYELNLVIEIDGQYHSYEEIYNKDVIRDEELSKYTLTVILFTEQDIRTDIDNVLKSIEHYILENYSKEIQS